MNEWMVDAREKGECECVFFVTKNGIRIHRKVSNKILNDVNSWKRCHSEQRAIFNQVFVVFKTKMDFLFYLKMV